MTDLFSNSNPTSQHESDFYDLDDAARGERIKPLALKALEDYDLAVSTIELLTNETNCIFQVNTSHGKRYAMRVTDPAACHFEDEVRAETLWLQNLKDDNSLLANLPVPTRGGAYFTRATAEGVPNERFCVVFEWIDGIDLSEDLSRENVISHGRLMACLHRNSDSLILPQQLKIRSYDSVFPFSAKGFASHEPVVLLQDDFRPLYRGRDSLITRGLRLAENLITQLYSEQTPRIIHHDLHMWNVMISRGKLVAIDFEDLMFGLPIQDIAVALYYYRAEGHNDDVFDLFRHGYEEILPWPVQELRQLQTLMVARRLMLLNYFYNLQDSESIEARQDFTTRALDSLEKELSELTI